MHTVDDATALPDAGPPARLGPTVARVLAVLAAVLLATSATVGAASVARAEPATATSLVLVLDASGSMNEPDGHGGTKIKAAKAALKTIIGQLPSDLQVGLRVYGHRVPSKPDHAKACQDTQLIAPVAPLDKAGLTAAIDGFKALGETPIGASLAAAAKDLPAGTSGSIVLVSDGQDSCAPPQPCDVARQLKASGVQLTVDTVGLKVDATAKTQLTCISDATGGTYTDVQDTAKLADSLGTIATRSRRTATVGGQPVEGKATQEEAPKLTVGKYSTDVVAKETLYYAFDVAAGQKVKVRITMDGQKFATNHDIGCCLTAKLQNVDGDQLGANNDYLESGKLKKMAVETREPVEQAGRLYLELTNDGGTTKPGQALPLVMEVEISGEASPSASAGAAGAGATDSGSPSSAAGAGSPGAPVPTVTVTVAPVGGGAGHSSTVVEAAGLGGLVAGIAVGALGAVLLLRRLGRDTATPPGPVPGAPGPLAASGAAQPPYGGPAAPHPYGGPTAQPPPPYGGPAAQPPPQYGGPAAQPPYGGPASQPPYGGPTAPPGYGGPAAPPPYAHGPGQGRATAPPPPGAGTLPPHDGG